MSDLLRMGYENSKHHKESSEINLPGVELGQDERNSPGAVLMYKFADYLMSIRETGKFDPVKAKAFGRLPDENPFHHYVGEVDGKPVWSEGKKIVDEILTATGPVDIEFSRTVYKKNEHDQGEPQIKMIVTIPNSDMIHKYTFVSWLDGSRQDVSMHGTLVRNEIEE